MTILAPVHQSRSKNIGAGGSREPDGRRDGRGLPGGRHAGPFAGHTSLLSDEHGLLLTADAFGAMARKLREEEYATVAFSHGAVLRDAAKDRLRQIVAACRY
jgi:hypothetical protein